MTVATILASKGRDVFTINPDLNLQAAARILADKRIGAVMVTGADGTIGGILSERDIVRAVARGGPAALDDAITKHMTAKVVTCQEHDLISDVMEQMTLGRFRHMPVVSDGRLIAIVSIGDVVKQRIAETEAESRQMRDYIQMAS